MALINLIDVDYSVGGPLLLERVNLAVESSERICIVGRNGAGKSTLLRLLIGELVPDDGERRLQDGVVVARLAQEVPASASGCVYDVVAEALGELGALLAEFHRLSEGGDADALHRVQAAVEAQGAWDLERRVQRSLSKVQIDPEADFASLSGGMKRRVLLARALVMDPDVLLLDEPTNHLDLDGIAWLEGFLLSYPGTVIFVTHDRSFLRALATRIIEIERGQLTSWPGDYDNYLRRVEERANSEALAEARFDKKLSQEEIWIRQGIKARRTRNEGRVRALKALRQERAKRRERTGSVRMEASEAKASGRKVIEAKGISFDWAGQPIVRDFSTTIMRGDRIGIIGPNGSGKTTLIRLLLGQMQPDQGSVILGSNLAVAYFDQLRSQLDDRSSAQDNVSEGLEFIEINGARKHVIGYLQDFLFSPERARAPITALSGGERNRLLLARLFARPSNLLVMDEPTNDLDVETLELLEDLLADYPGTLLLVSHDREFLDNVVTSTLVLEGDGRVGEYVGGYSDWLVQRQRAMAIPAQPAEAVRAAAKAPERRKLNYRDSRELEQLPGLIETLEAEVARATAAMADALYYQRGAAAITADQTALAELQARLDAAYGRWAELDSGGG